jgi:hypothetical protein
MPRFTLLALLLASSAPLPPGFAIRDLTKVPFDAAATLGGGYLSRVEADRMTLMCSDCAGRPVIDVRIGRQEDGTEGRVRDGTTTMAQLESTCKAREPSCRIEALRVAPAVGWMSSYRFGEQFSHTIVVLRDGDLLTIRSMSEDPVTARRNADALVGSLVRTVVGS